MTIAPRHVLPALGLSLALGLAPVQAASPPQTGSLQVQLEDAAGRPLADAIVFLESREAREARAAVRPARDAVIAQVDKRFIPSVTVVPVGTPVEFPNRDTVRHHVYSFSPVKPFELKLYAGSPANPVVFDRAGVAVLGCNIHDQMTAWVLVVETPYFARSAAGGRATLGAVPPGSYRLRAWHAGLPMGAPASDQPITVAAGDNAATVRFAPTPK